MLKNSMVLPVFSAPFLPLDLVAKRPTDQKTGTEAVEHKVDFSLSLRIIRAIVASIEVSTAVQFYFLTFRDDGGQNKTAFDFRFEL